MRKHRSHTSWTPLRKLIPDGSEPDISGPSCCSARRRQLITGWAVAPRVPGMREGSGSDSTGSPWRTACQLRPSPADIRPGNQVVGFKPIRPQPKSANKPLEPASVARGAHKAERTMSSSSLGRAPRSQGRRCVRYDSRVHASSMARILAASAESKAS
jgi:hypothetical protein